MRLVWVGRSVHRSMQRRALIAAASEVRRTTTCLIMSGGGFLPAPYDQADDPFSIDIPEAPPERKPDLPAKRHIKSLSLVQEHRLVDFLDDRFLKLSRGLSRRWAEPISLRCRLICFDSYEPESDFRTLAALLAFCRPVLEVILRIPP